MNPSNFLETLETFEFLVFGKWPVEGYGRLVGESFRTQKGEDFGSAVASLSVEDVGRRFDPAPPTSY
jgi:hypothetical protein